jgi:hypothetical protein
MADNHVESLLFFAEVEPDDKPKVVADNGKKNIENRRISKADVAGDIIKKIYYQGVDAKDYGPSHDKGEKIRAVF